MREDNYHILIRNLTTNEKQGFMLMAGDKPYQVQGVDNIAQRIQDGEILYSDFTNSRVFAQSDWNEGVSKYWDPEYSGYYIFPSKKYKDKKNIEIRTGEFTLGGSVEEEFTLPDGGEGPMCRGETAGVVYVGSGMKLYRSTDFGDTFALWKDFTGHAQLSDVDEITDITITNTEPFSMPHAAPMGTISIGAVQELFVAFYNRATQATGIARYDISFTIRGALGTTFKDGWGVSSSAAYGSDRTSLTVDTSALSAGGFAASKVNTPYTLTIPASWATYGLYPGQPVRLNRTATGVNYDLTVSFVGGAFGGVQEFGVVGIPAYDSMTPANNVYTVSNIGRNSPTICLPITAGGIESFTNVGDGLGQNVIYNGITYNIRGLGNGRDRFGDIPGYSPGVGSGNANYVMLTRIDAGDGYTGIGGTGTQVLVPEDWIYKFGTYLNKVTKFIKTEKDLCHIWGYDHINPLNKLYDVGFGEIASSLGTSNVYNNSYNGVIHSAQNHTVTFNDGDCPTAGTGVGYAEGLPSGDPPLMYIGTQYGSAGLGTQGSLFQFTLNDSTMVAPAYTIKGSVGVNAITCMVYFSSKLYFGSKKKGLIWEWNDSNSLLTELAQLPLDPTTEETIIDAMTVYAGKIVCSYQAGTGIYTLDPTTRQNASPLIETDVLCSVEGLSNMRIYNICNTGGSLLFVTNGKVYSYDPSGIAATGYMESSIYGGYISNVEKQWVYAYLRVGKWSSDDGQRVALEVSLDEGATWNFCPTEPGGAFSPTNTWTNDTSIGYTNLEDPRKQQAVFYFPYYSLSGTIIYRAWLKKGTTVKPFVNHIGVHYYLNYKQELLFNYVFTLGKAMELTGGREIEKNLSTDKLNFLKDIWTNQYQVEVTDVNGKKYICVPYSDDRTPGQGLIISTLNSNSGHQALENLEFQVALSLKTIANYTRTL